MTIFASVLAPLLTAAAAGPAFADTAVAVASAGEHHHHGTVVVAGGGTVHVESCDDECVATTSTGTATAIALAGANGHITIESAGESGPATVQNGGCVSHIATASAGADDAHLLTTVMGIVHCHCPW